MKRVILDLFGFRKEIWVADYLPYFNIIIEPEIETFLSDSVKINDTPLSKQIRFVRVFENIYRPTK